MMFYSGTGGGGFWWEWLISFCAMVLLGGLAIAIVISLMRSLHLHQHDHSTPLREGQGSPADDEPERTLARRFANGEIDDEEFRRRLEVLRAHGPAARS